MASVNQGKTKYNFEPLNGNNDHNWKFRISMILDENACKEKVEKETDIATLDDDAKRQLTRKKITKQCL